MMGVHRGPITTDRGYDLQASRRYMRSQPLVMMKSVLNGQGIFVSSSSQLSHIELFCFHFSSPRRTSHRRPCPWPLQYATGSTIRIFR